jgi:CheY-like chemotaxis protein
MNTTVTEKYLERITYEVRTSMNSMLGLAELLWETRLDSAQREFVNMFRLSADRLLQMNNGIAELAEPQHGNASSVGSFDVREVLKQITGLMSVLAAEKGISLTHTAQPGVPALVRGERKRLEQVLVALIRNAIRFTEQGHIVVQVEQERSSSEDIVLRFIVKDTGIGIAADRIGSLFNLSEGGDDYRGLGLLVTRRAVESMNGTIWVESELANGSSFCFTAVFQPDVTSKNLPGSAASTWGTQVNPGLRILIAEDSEDNMFILQAFLRGQDIHIERAENGRIALDKLKSNRYDLVLMDVEMPILDGYETTRQLRAWEQETAVCSVPVVALTAHTGPDHLGRSIDAGCTAYLAKPINKRALVETINRYALRPRWPEDVTDNYRPDVANHYR